MVNGFETEMDQWMMKREELSRRADQLKEQREDILQATEVGGVEGEKGEERDGRGEKREGLICLYMHI